MKRSLKLLMTLALVLLLAGLGLRPLEAQAASSGTCGDNLTWTLSDAGVMTISGTGLMTDYRYASDAPWADVSEEIRTISVGSGVTSVGDRAFSGCTRLTTVTIQGSASIGYDAFSGCTNLYTVMMDKVTSIDNYAFFNNAKLSNLSMSSVQSIGQCAFKNCTRLTKLTINNAVEIKQEAFNNCTALTSVSMNKVESTGDGAFKGCSNLVSVTMPKIKSLGSGSFSGCDKLTNVVFPETLTTIGGSSFYNCDALTSLVIPATVTTIGSEAFEYCDGLKSLVIEGDPALGWRAFRWCKALETVEMNKVSQVSDEAFAGCTALTTVEMKNVVKIGGNAFSGAESLKKAVMDKADTIGYCAFNGCKSLMSVSMKNVLSIGGEAFQGCTSLTAVTIPYTLSSDGLGSYAFDGCTGLTDVTMEAICELSAKAFSGCTSLKNVSIPDVTSIGNSTFAGCTSLTVIDMPWVSTIGHSAFWCCTGLTKIGVSSFLTEITGYAFDDCTALSDVYYSGSEAEWNQISIGGGNSNLTNATIHHNSTILGATPVGITSIISNHTAKLGGTVSVTIGAVGDGLTYTWYYKDEGSSTFTKTSSFTGPTYSIEMNEERDGRQVYCVVKDKYGSKVTSTTVTLSLSKTALKIVTQPKDIAVKSGETALVTLKAQGDGLTYTWYYKNKGSASFTKTTSFTGPSYSVDMTASRSGRQVYCLVRDTYGNQVQSNVVTLTMSTTPLKILTQPVDISVKSGETALVTLKAQGDDLTYTWYYKNKGSSSFTKTTSFTGPSYSVAMTASRSGRQVYCLIKDGYGNQVQSNVVTLTMNTTPLKIVSQSGNVTVAAGETAMVTVEATGDGLTYEWYYKNAGASKYTRTTTFKGNSYSLVMNASRSGRRVYCKITDAYGNTVKTSSVVLTMETTPLEIVTQPESITLSSGETGKITVKATGDGLTYAWYYKNATATKFTKTSTFTGPEYSLSMTKSRSGRHVYCVITDAYGKKVTTDIVTLNMDATLELLDQPGDVTARNGETVEITVDAAGDGLKYAWYYRNAGKTEFTKTSTFKGDSYSLEMNSTRNGRQVYCVITDVYGFSVATDVVTFTAKN